MSKPNCDACTNLRDYAPEFVANGVTDRVAASLKNNTGLNHSLTTLHNDCDDLNDVNDCLIGRMDDELESYDVCDWKHFMHKFIPNLYETIKAMIAAICGLWKKAETIDVLCEQLKYIYNPPTSIYGTIPNQGDEHRIGTINKKNGNPLLIPMTEAEAGHPYSWPSQNVGIAYGRKQMSDCASRACRLYEWISPHLMWYKFADNVADGDILWYCTKQEALDVMGMSDYLWDLYTRSSYTWTDYPISNRTQGWVRLTIDPNGMGANYLVMVYRGSTYPNPSPAGHYIQPSTNPDKMYSSNCV